MREVFVDYDHIGHACRFQTRLFRSEREGLEVGEVIPVVGDAVEARRARVVEMSTDGREVELEFVAFSDL